MRTRIRHFATPRRIVASECCVALIAAVLVALAFDAGALAIALLAVCMLTMVTPLVAVGRLEKRGSSD